jgi:hypothetical protein
LTIARTSWGLRRIGMTNEQKINEYRDRTLGDELPQIRFNDDDSVKCKQCGQFFTPEDEEEFCGEMCEKIFAGEQMEDR